MNLPNKLSTLRICLVPLFIAAYFLPYFWGAYVAVGIFVIAAFTDFLDGYIARKYNMTTDLGKLLDPIADKILVTSALFCVVATNPLQYLTYLDTCGENIEWIVMSNHAWATQFGMIFLAVGGAMIISRELLVSAVRQIAASKGVVVQANVFGKIKTVFQDVSLPLLIVLQAFNFFANKQFGYTPTLFPVIVWWVAVVLFAISVVLTLVSGIIYLVQNKKVFAKE